MVYSNSTTYVGSPNKSNRANGPIQYIVLHHMAEVGGYGGLNAMIRGTKEVSANYVVTSDGKGWAVVDEDRRAWTSGSSRDGGKGAWYDSKAITFEIANDTAAPGWTVPEASYRTVAALMAEVSARYGIPLDRDHVIGHRELWTRYGASYATACPGGLDMDRLVQMALAIKNKTAGGSDPATPVPVTPIWKREEAEEMPYMIKAIDGEGRWSKSPAGQAFLAIITDDEFLEISPKNVAQGNEFARRFGDAVNVTYATWDGLKVNRKYVKAY